MWADDQVVICCLCGMCCGDTKTLRGDTQNVTKSALDLMMTNIPMDHVEVLFVLSVKTVRKITLCSLSAVAVGARDNVTQEVLVMFIREEIAIKLLAVKTSKPLIFEITVIAN